MRFNYALKEYDKEKMARVIGRALPVSLKHAVEISSFIKGKTTEYAKRYLEDVITQKKAIPFTKFNKGVGHKKAMGPARYPLKASTEIKSLLESAEANAQFKGLNTSSLSIIHISANKAQTQWHSGRQRRRKMKRTHIEIVVEETKKSEKPQNKKETAQKQKQKPKTDIPKQVQEQKKAKENKKNNESKKEEEKEPKK